MQMARLIVSMAAIEKRHKISDRTFTNYVKNGGRRNRPGRKSLTSDCNTKFIAQHIVQADRANEGLTSMLGEIVTKVQLIHAGTENELLKQQASNWTFRKSNPHHTKTGLTKAQKTTSKRSKLSVVNQ